MGNAQEHAYLSVPKPHSATAAFNTAGGELDCDGAWFFRAPFKSISLLLCLGSLGCRSEASATKDSVDALTCVSYLELRERKPTRCGFEMGSSGKVARNVGWNLP